MASIQTARMQPSTEASQYQHFIPRLILRNFSFKSQRDDDDRNQRVKDMLHTIDLSGPTAKIIDTSVARTLGKVDMYRDFARTENQQAIEEQLAKLERHAGMVIAEIRKRFGTGVKDVLEHAQALHHETSEDYSADDRQGMLEYMRRKGFENPIDVWFDNIKAMLELEMDPKGEWVNEIRKRAYPDDADWFVVHIKSMYMALCTPSEQEDEFLLTENGYGIHEGPVSGRLNPSTGEFTPTIYTEYHVFVVISPRLMIVLRSNMLPNPTEDISQDMRESRQAMYRATIDSHDFPKEASSILEDLPISKARNSYTKFEGGQLVLLNGEDETPQATHRFCFRLFPISEEHVNKINAVMLEESYSISTIVFGSPTRARKILESYLSAPTRGKFGFKVEMGSNVVAIYHTINITPTNEERDELASRMTELDFSQERTEHMQLYMRLGGSYATIMKDLEQARNMLNMRIKFDIWSTGLDERLRNDIRENFQHIFSQLPVRRVWYYLKHVRIMALQGLSIEGGEIMDGPEDIIARVSQVIRSEDIARLMFATILNQISIAKHPDFDLYPKIISQDLLGSIFRRSKQIAFTSAGSICDCGINEIERKARLFRDKLQTPSYPSTFANLFLPKDAMIRHPFWSDEQHIEMHTRFHTRVVFPGLLAKLGEKEEGNLDEVLFEIAYPCPSPSHDFGSKRKRMEALILIANYAYN
ncbi:hypothetical protein V493_00439 [Pseudogymnoascus sp. VKM F-4281 (FW-2241)]|nr:hypothetical protein V493_00439 [Pseudogymnoascus sp. VKM F-4281 (FW-2241)]